MAEKPHIDAWRGLKFGMFIHWGLYSLHGRGEWAMFQEQLDVDDYARLAKQFAAERFDAAHWAAAAKAAGMRYMVFTARHHDGFSLFDSRSSIGNFTSMRCAARRDFTAAYTDACRAAGLAVGLYYSPNDWRCPASYLPRLYRKNARAMREQCHRQVEELMTNYGKIDILWYDAGQDSIPGRYSPYHKLDMEQFEQNIPWPGFWEAEKLDRRVRELQPGIVINNRLGTPLLGDFGTPECRVGEFDPVRPWETCEQLADGAWGWRPGCELKSLRQILVLLVRVVTGDGNLLLNVGPKADGSMEPDQVARLAQVGTWLGQYGESIYGTRGGPIPNGAWGGTTYRDNILYVHVVEWTRDEVQIPLGSGRIRSAACLTARTGEHAVRDGALALRVGEEDRQATDTIFRVEFEGSVAAAYGVSGQPAADAGREPPPPAQ